MKKNAQRHARRVGSGFETLENRTLCAVGVAATNGTLRITGDDAPNLVRVNQNQTQYLVTVGSNAPLTFAKAGVQRVEANLGAGNDNYAGNVGIPQLLNGGTGNDRLVGGGAADQIFGGDGIDVLLGGAGNDFLNGNAGIDYLNGGAGSDRYETVDNGTPDRLNGLTAQDSIHGDVLNNVTGNVYVNSQDNTVSFVGKTVDLRRAYVQGQTGIFYRATVNGVDKGLFRAVNTISVYTPQFGTGNSFTIDATLRGELEAQHLLNVGKLA
jgi:hypothetical protein